MGLVRIGAKAAVVGSLLLVQALACPPSFATGGRSTPNTGEDGAPIFDPDAYGTPTPAPAPTATPPLSPAEQRFVEDLENQVIEDAASFAIEHLADYMKELGEAGQLSQITRFGQSLALGGIALQLGSVAIDTAEVFDTVDAQIKADDLSGAAVTVSKYAARTAMGVIGLPMADQVVEGTVIVGNRLVGAAIDLGFDVYDRIKGYK
jgi:hypothetical protein